VDSREQRAARRRALDALLADVRALADTGDEFAVIRRVVDRLQLGRRTYGPLRVDDPRRSWPLERAFELADGDLYGVFELVRLERTRAGKPTQP
jgi:hypothetical protein